MKKEQIYGRTQSNAHSRIVIMTLCLCCMFVLNACSQTTANTHTDVTKMRVATSFLPLFEMATLIAGNASTVISIVPINSEPHDFAMTAQTAAQLSDTQLIILLGAGMEPYHQELEELSNARIVEVTDSMELHTLQAHDDGHSSDTNETLPQDEHDDDGIDPHVWLSVARMSTIVERIAAEMIISDPANTATYKQNAQIIIDDLDELNNYAITKFSSCKSHEFILTHGFLGYFCDDYNCTQTGVESIAPQAQTGAGTLAAMINHARENKIQTIVTPAGEDDPLATTLRAELNATLVEFDPYEYKRDEQGSYREIMKQNIDALAAGLACS